MGDLGVLVSFKITRGIKLVVGRVTEGVKGGLREFWGGPGGSKGVCLTPIGHFLPLWKSCGRQIWFDTPHDGPTDPC